MFPLDTHDGQGMSIFAPHRISAMEASPTDLFGTLADHVNHGLDSAKLSHQNSITKLME